ncbi:sodium/calcium exchanger 3-like [Argonauta hians]
MCSIERITSKTRKIRISDPKDKGGFREIEVKVWNDTVANLSLMALGTSAPEILLSVIETIGNKFEPGELGPATIVGSAAFNLLVITSVCMVSIPEGETRQIKSVKVFGVTSVFNMSAYIWLAIVLLASSKDIVKVWEAVFTFSLFPILIGIAFLADKNFFRTKNKIGTPVEIGIELGNEVDYPGINDSTVDIIEISRELGRNKNLSPDEAAKLAAATVAQNQTHTSAWYRINATRSMSGGQKLVPQVSKAFVNIFQGIQPGMRECVQESRASLKGDTPDDLSDHGNKAVVEFTASSYAVMENEGHVKIGIKRTGCLDITATVWVETYDGTAESGSDYRPIKETVVFEPNEHSKEIQVEIIDDDVWEPDEFFYIKLYIDSDSTDRVVLGKIAINMVTIINDDEPGRLEFSKPSYVVKESLPNALATVNRINGADGEITVSWQTTPISATDGTDFVGGNGILTFAHGETSKNIDIPILGKSGKTDLNFQLELSDPTCGAEIGRTNRTIITIVSDEEFNSMVSRIANLTKQNLDSLKLESATWGEQFKQAMNVNGGDIENATNMDYGMHFLTFFWKIIFAFVPPPSLCGGWLTFVFSLAMIGVITALISDLATIFGCLINLNKSITAITLVALGTSMPDTFASRQAALQEKWADNAIGNINGSNAVNVFLGLGLPWFIASIYHYSNDSQFSFQGKTESLAFTVVLYTIFSALTMTLLILRRLHPIFGKAELGGPTIPKYISAGCTFLMWVLYILFSILQISGVIHVKI